MGSSGEIIRALYTPSVSDAKGQIDFGACQGFMTESFLNGHDIRPGFIQMQSESVAAAMEHKTAVCKAGTLNGIVKNVADGLVINVGTFLLSGKKPVLAGGTVICLTDVVGQDKQGFF